MNDQPDLSTLPQRMRYAADILEEVNARLVATGLADQYRVWNHDGLRSRADKWEAEDRAADELDELADWLSAALCGWMGDMTTTICRRTAAGLIESGWSKGDPE